MIIGDAVIVLQARMASTRLPGKALRELAGHSLVWHCLTRLLRSKVAPVVLATTRGLEDDLLVLEAERLGVDVLRGPRDDVLGRFVLVAQQWRARYVVRATADNPAVDIDAPARTLRLLHKHKADLVVEAGLPYGCAVEAVRATALYRAAAESGDPQEREHVTLRLKRQSDVYRVQTPDAPPELRRPDLRLTVDTPEDLLFMRRVLDRARAETEPVPLARIIQAADELGTRARVA